ncbi:hypothetical protein FS749_000920 [Ceratobasidium sp. UAMH 11750]|nr:hypothetical protein FS749_000920 [Ceratobasidium sp. UAMH 11750]
MNREDDDTATELAVSNYNSAFNYNIGRLAGDCSRHTNPKVRKLLKDTAKSVGIDSANELPEDEHPSVEQQDAPEQDGQGEDIPVEEVWEDEDTTSIVEGVDIVHMRHYLMMMVSGPILFEQQFRKEIEANGGELVCPKCREFLPEGTWTIFSKVSNLGKHMRNAHTDWKDLKYKMACGPNKFKCPGACDSSQTDVREHCLSPECVDQQAFLDMKKSHDLAEKLRLESRRDEFARDRTEHPRNRRKIRARQIRYLSTLDRGDILELADEFKIPHHEVEPYADKMLAITRFIGDMLL